MDVGCQGRISDGGVFSNTDLCKRMEQKIINFPEATPLTNEKEEKLPFFFVGDEAFAMTENLIKPYPGYYT